MKFDFLSIGWSSIHLKEDMQENLESKSVIIEKPEQKAGFDIKLWICSLISLVPWAINGRDDNRGPTTINRRLKKRARLQGFNDPTLRVNHVKFRPYVSKVPWHKGARAFLSQLFPRYGHYCGPNWSSGKDKGSHIWDRRPIDWLDYCCYCHDIGYDTHDQAELLRADLEFLECLERPHMSTMGDARAATIYRTMCILGRLAYSFFLLFIFIMLVLCSFCHCFYAIDSNQHAVNGRSEDYVNTV